MTLWLAGRMNVDPAVALSSCEPWEVLGIYDEEAKAVARCTSWYDFVGPIRLNEDAPEPTIPWPGCYYPLAKEAID